MSSQCCEVQAHFEKRFTPLNALKLALAVCSLDREPTAIKALLQATENADFNQALALITIHNLRVVAKRYETRPLVGAYFYFSVICHQMRYIALAMQASRYAFLAITDLAALDVNNQSRIKDLEGLTYLAIPNEGYLANINALAAIFLPEFNERYHWPLPPHTLRLGCAHGIDVPATHSLTTYGGAHLFDAVLSPSVANPLPQDFLLDCVPRCLVDHPRNTVTIIPFGSPKLDALHQLSQRHKEHCKRIIYHLSNWELESEPSKANLLHNLRTLASYFKHYEVLFRPFPNDLTRPEIRAVIAQCTDLNNLTLSTGSTYIEDYASASFMVTHRENTGLNFAFACDRPIFCIEGAKSGEAVRLTEYGYKVANMETLLEQASAYLNGQSIPEKLLQKTRTIANRGNAMATFLENFDALLAGTAVTGWQRLALFREDSHSKNTVPEIISALETKRDGPFAYIPLACAAVAQHPNNPDLHLLCAQAFSKTPNPLAQPFYFYYWYRAFGCIARALGCRRSQRQTHKLTHWLLNSASSMAHELSLYLQQPREFGNDFYTLITGIQQQVPLFKPQRLPLSKRLNYHIDAKVLDTIVKASGPGKELILFGANDLAEKVIIENRRHQHFDVCAVYDSNPEKVGTQLAGVTVTPLTHRPDETPILICSLTHADAMRRQLQQQFGRSEAVLGIDEILTQVQCA